MPQNNYHQNLEESDSVDIEAAAYFSRTKPTNINDAAPMTEVVGRTFKSADILVDHVHTLHDRLLGSTANASKQKDSTNNSGVYGNIITHAEEIDMKCMNAVRMIEAILQRT